jgi:hypothetical protein
MGLATSPEKREFSQVSLEIDLWGFPTSPFPILLGWNNPKKFCSQFRLKGYIMYECCMC